MQQYEYKGSPLIFPIKWMEVAYVCVTHLKRWLHAQALRVLSRLSVWNKWAAKELKHCQVKGIFEKWNKFLSQVLL